MKRILNRKSKKVIPLILSIAMVIAMMPPFALTVIAAEPPTELVNGSFEYPSLNGLATHANWWYNFYPFAIAGHAAGTYARGATTGTISGYDSSEFGWDTTAQDPDRFFEFGGKWNISSWGVGFIPDGDQFIELNANIQAASYQDLTTSPGQIIYWSLYQGGVWYPDSTDINNTMTVRIGSPEQLSTSAIMITTDATDYDQAWTKRTIYDIATMTAVSIDSVNDPYKANYINTESNKKQLYTEPKRWTKYEGMYVVPEGQTLTRFAFASLATLTPTQGNLLDGVVFRVATDEDLTSLDTTVPTVTSLSPADDAANIEVTSNLVMNFSENVVIGTGNILIKKTSDNSTVETIDVTSGQVTGGGTPSITIDPAAALEGETSYYIQIPATAFDDAAGNSYAGIDNPASWSFTTANTSHGHSNPAPTSNTIVIVNGQSQNLGSTTTSTVGGQSVTTITIDDKAIQNKLDQEGSNSTILIPVNNNSDVVVGQLNGMTIKNMEQKESVLEIQAGNVTYTLPASQINIDSISKQIGMDVDLADIKVSISISNSSADMAKIIEDTANKNNYQVVVKPVDFEITCTSGSKTVEISRFNGYVERTIAIPDGVDPSKITTGIVLNSDGTFTHVPTTITVINGKYYAKINSLTNSTYSVIYNSVDFADVAAQWAKDSIKNMGSRLIVTGNETGSYNPDKDITRAEFAAIIVRALGLTPDAAKNTFVDVAESEWYCGYVGTAAANGIISGYDTGAFGPNDKITREQAMVMIARAMKLTGLGTDLADLEMSSLLANYTDTDYVSTYAERSIAACVKANVVSGRSDGTIAPKDNITRAEVAVIVERLLKNSKLI